MRSKMVSGRYKRKTKIPLPSSITLSLSDLRYHVDLLLSVRRCFFITITVNWIM